MPRVKNSPFSSMDSKSSQSRASCRSSGESVSSSRGSRARAKTRTSSIRALESSPGCSCPCRAALRPMFRGKGLWAIFLDAESVLHRYHHRLHLLQENQKNLIIPGPCTNRSCVTVNV